MTTIRSFIAISLSQELVRSLDDLIRQLRNQAPNGVVRWVAAANIHITLKFLGDVPQSNLDLLKKMLESEARQRLGFEIEIGNLGAFPNFSRPRVVWVGAKAPADLADLQCAVESEAARLGFPPEERPFSPHLTIGRVIRTASPQDVQRLGQSLSAIKAGVLGKVQVQELHLYRSDLQPGGSIYTRLYTARLELPANSSLPNASSERDKL